MAETQDMSEPPRRTTGWLVIAGVLLAIPAALAIGWGLGQLPTPEPAVTAVAPATTDRTVASASDAREPAPSIEVGGGVQTVDVPVSGAGPDRSSSPPSPSPAPVREPEAPSEPAVRDELSQWTTIDLAIEESRRTGKPVMIDFNADWCPPCRRMKREVFEDGTHAAAVQTAVIPVSIVDRVREEGRNPPEIDDLKRRFEIEAFPTLIVLNPATGRTQRSRGYGGAERTVAWITWAAGSVR